MNYAASSTVHKIGGASARVPFCKFPGIFNEERSYIFGFLKYLTNKSENFPLEVANGGNEFQIGERRLRYFLP